MSALSSSSQFIEVEEALRLKWSLLVLLVTVNIAKDIFVKKILLTKGLFYIKFHFFAVMEFNALTSSDVTDSFLNGHLGKTY